MDTSYNSLSIHSPIAKFTSNSDILSPILPPQQLPASHTSHATPPPPNELHLSQAQVASMRRKKNADAQAAFRARRANYISSLEETVLSLEAVVMSLQDSCRESRNDADDLRRENSHLRSSIESLQKESRDRERQWREFLVAKLQALGLDDPQQLNDFPPRLPPVNSDSTHSATYNLRTLSFTESDALRFSTNQRFPSSSAGHSLSATYSSNSDPNWVPAASFSNTRTPCIDQSQPSSASESPSSVSFSSRFSIPGHDSRSLDLVTMSNASYETNSLMAECGSEGYSTSTTTTTRQSVSESERCVRQRRSYSGPHPRGNDFYGASDISPPDSDHFNGEDPTGINENDFTPNSARPRRHTFASMTPHSPSLSPPLRGGDLRERDMAVSNTLAVIKAQAFGSLRRPRTRVKKTSDSNNKVALSLLSARGIGLGLQPPVTDETTPRMRVKRKSECLDDVEI